MAFALLDELAGMGNLLRRQLGLTAHLHPTGDRRRAAQPVELPDGERVALVERLEAPCQFRPLDVRPGRLVGNDALAPRLLESGKLQVGVLVFGRDPRVANFHGPVLSLIYGTSKPLIEQGQGFASKILIYGPEFLCGVQNSRLAG